MEPSFAYKIAKQLALEWVCGGRQPNLYFEQQMVRAMTAVGQIAINRALDAMEEKPTSTNCQSAPCCPSCGSINVSVECLNCNTIWHP